MKKAKRSTNKTNNSNRKTNTKTNKKNVHKRRTYKRRTKKQKSINIFMIILIILIIMLAYYGIKKVNAPTENNIYKDACKYSIKKMKVKNRIQPNKCEEAIKTIEEKIKERKDTSCIQVTSADEEYSSFYKKVKTICNYTNTGDEEIGYTKFTLKNGKTIELYQSEVGKLFNNKEMTDPDVYEIFYVNSKEFINNEFKTILGLYGTGCGEKNEKLVHVIDNYYIYKETVIEEC